MHEADRALSVQFFLAPIENPKKSKEEGRPIYDEVEMVSIMAAGNTKTEFTARADRMHWDGNNNKQWTYAERFPDHYAQFKQGIAEQVSGTPITEAPFLTVGQKAELKADGIKTIEQLAAMSDTNIRRKGMGYRERVDKARAYLDATTGTTQVFKELEDLRAQLAALQGEKAPETPAEAPVMGFDQYSDEDLRNMLTDAGKTPDGRWGRDRLVKELTDMAEEAA